MSNCFNMRCPQCRSEDHIDVCAYTLVRLTEKGTNARRSSDPTHHFEPESTATCARCGFWGHAQDFSRVRLAR